MRLHEHGGGPNSAMPEQKDTNTRWHSRQPKECVADNILETGMIFEDYNLAGGVPISGISAALNKEDAARRSTTNAE